MPPPTLTFPKAVELANEFAKTTQIVKPKQFRRYLEGLGYVEYEKTHKVNGLFPIIPITPTVIRVALIGSSNVGCIERKRKDNGKGWWKSLVYEE